MTKWEYKITRFYNYLETCDSEEIALKNYGIMGWELVSVVNRPCIMGPSGVTTNVTEYVFKKPIEE